MVHVLVEMPCNDGESLNAFLDPLDSTSSFLHSNLSIPALHHCIVINRYRTHLFAPMLSSCPTNYSVSDSSAYNAKSPFITAPSMIWLDYLLVHPTSLLLPPTPAPHSSPFANHSGGQISVDAVHAFILHSNFPRYEVRPTESTKTHGYSSVGHALPAEDVPFFLSQDRTLVDRMAADLRARVLPAFKTLEDLASFEFAKSRLREIDTRAAKNEIILTHEPSVWKVTDDQLAVCTNLVRALGCTLPIDSEVNEATVGVVIDRLVRERGNGLLGWEDKSPAVFAKHCTEENISQTIGAIEIAVSGETGFRGILFKVSRR
jgi:hypothetical protein